VYNFIICELSVNILQWSSYGVPTHFAYKRDWHWGFSWDSNMSTQAFLGHNFSNRFNCHHHSTI